MYKTVIAPSLQYGTKIAVLTKKSRVMIANYEKLILRNIYQYCMKPNDLKFNARKLLEGKTINRRIRIARISYFGHVLRRENNHPLKLAYNLNFEKKKEGRPSLTWKNSLDQDFQKFENMDRTGFEELSKDRENMKRKLKEIYSNDDSEISEGESSDENTKGKKYRHWRKKLKLGD